MGTTERTLPRRERNAIRIALFGIAAVLLMLVLREHIVHGAASPPAREGQVRVTEGARAGPDGSRPLARGPGARRPGSPGGPLRPDDGEYAALAGQFIEFPTTTMDGEDEDTTSPLRGEGVLIGWVTDEAGHGVPGVRLRVHAMGAGGVEIGDGGPAAESSSNESGAFAIEGLAAGTWAVMASAPGYGDTPTLGINVPPAGRCEPVRIRLAQSLSVQGRVTAAGNIPVAGASLVATRSMLAITDRGEAATRHVRVSRRVESTSDGNFHVEGLPPGSIRLTVEAPGFATTSVDVRLEADARGVAVRLDPQAAFGGVVRDSRNQPVKGADLAIETGTIPPRKLATKSGEDGRFAFDSLPSGIEVSLRAGAAGFAPVGPLRFVTGTRQNVIVLGVGGAIAGRVLDIDSGAGTGGIGVFARGPLPSGRTVRTESRPDGTYALQGLAPGKYEVFVRDPRYVARKSITCEALEGKVRLRTDFEVYEGLAIRGTVVEEDTRQAIPGALVSLNGSAGGSLPPEAARAARTDATGWFELRNVPEGRFLLHAQAAGWISTRDSRTGVRITTSRRQPPIPASVSMVRSGRIEGLARFPGGAPVPDALVQLFSDGGAGPEPTPFRATTDSSGYYSIQGVPADEGTGLLLVARTEDGLSGRTTPFSLSGLAPDIWEDIEVDAGSPLEVRVRSRSGGTIAGADVVLTHAQFPQAGSESAWRGTTDAAGQCVIAHVPKGSVLLNVSRQGFTTAIRAAEHGGGRPVEVELEAALAIAGVVEDDLGHALESGLVAAEPGDSSSPRAEAPLRRNGAFRIEGVRPGAHTLRVQVPGANGAPRERSFHGIHAGRDGALKLVVPMNGSVVGEATSAASRDPLPTFTARLELLDGSSGDGARTVATREFRGGEYRFEGLIPGTYRLRVEAPGYLPEYSESFAVSSPDRTAGPEVSLRVGGRLRLRVVDAQSGKGIPGATASVLESGDTARATSDGTIVLGPLEPGLWTVTAAHPEYLPAERHLVRVMAGKESNEGKVRLERGAELSGVVRDGRGRGLEGAMVEVAEEGESERRSATTDSGGKFRITGLRPGSALAIASGEVGRRRVSQASEVVLLRDKSAPVEFTLAADSRLEGRLIGPPGADVSRAIVDLYPLEPDNTPRLNERVEADSTPDGFVASDIAEGTYLVTVRSPNGSGESAWYGIAPVRGSVSRVAVVAGSKVLAGRVLERADGPALARQRVRLGLLTAPQSGVERLSRWWRRSTRTRNDGSYLFQNLDAGNYDLGATNPTYPSDVMDVISLGEESPGRRLDLQFLPEPGVVEVN